MESYLSNLRESKKRIGNILKIMFVLFSSLIYSTLNFSRTLKKPRRLQQLLASVCDSHIRKHTEKQAPPFIAYSHSAAQRCVPFHFRHSRHNRNSSRDEAENLRKNKFRA